MFMQAIRLSLESFRNSRTEVRNMNQTVDKYDLPNLPSSSAATAAPGETHAAEVQGECWNLP